MWEYEIMHKTTKERDIIFGYSYADALRRSKVNGDEYTCLMVEYID